MPVDALADLSPSAAPLSGAEAPPVAAGEPSVLGIAELLLKAPARLDALTRAEGRQAELIPRLLALALAGYALFAAVLVVLFLASPAAVPGILGASWTGSAGPALALGLAYPVGLVASTGICLPAFYFFGLLAGVRASALQVTAHVLKGKAATALLLLGVLPIYLAVTLGLRVFAAPPAALEAALAVGLALPFLAGLWGVRSIYVGFLGLADTLAPERRGRRTVS